MTTERAPDEAQRWKTLARYLAGESSAAEAEQVRRWLAEDPGRAELLAALQRATASLQSTASQDLDVEAALRRVAARLDEPVHARTGVRGRTRWTGGWLRAAAIVALLLGTTVIVWQLSRDRATAPGAIAARTFSAPVGTVDSVRLADGTRVVLAPGSHLTTDADYGSSSHRVELAGEALFDVAAAAAGRFTVHAGQAVIRDLGTRFAVRSDVAEVHVVVTSGAVVLSAVAAGDSGTVLRAGDRGMLSQAGQISAQRGGATRDDLAWTDGRLVFDNATLAQVAEQLRRWYGIRLQFADSALARRHVTASFEGEDVERVLAVLALALAVDIERTGETALVRERR